jgi:biopolymer transport protein ExbD
MDVFIDAPHFSQIARVCSRKMKSNLVILVVLLSFVAATVTAQKPEPAPLPEKQKAAEEAADRVMRRFYETLVGQTYQALFSDRRKILTADTLEKQFTNVMDQMNNEIRKCVIRENFNTAIYKTKISQAPEDQPDEKAELQKLFLGLGSLRPDNEIYVVRREAYYLYLIEENGSFKLLTESSRFRF